VRNKYTYAGCVVTVGGAASVASYYGSAAGNSTFGIFALGTNSSTYTAMTTRDKYYYAGCVVGSATASTAGSSSGAATSNGISGITTL
jgi:hypothetical protein